MISKNIYQLKSVLLILSCILWATPIIGQSADLLKQVATGFQKSFILDLPSNPELTDYIKVAASRNPQVISAYARWQAEVDRIAVAKGLPNPNLSFGYFLSNVETAVGPQEFKIGLTQMIPWFGKLKLAGKLQTIQADIQLEQLQTQINALIYNVTLVYLDYYFLQRSIDITKQNIELVRNWEQVVKSKYITTRASHPDLIKTQIELMKLEDDQKSLVAKREPLLEKFRTLLNNHDLQSIALTDSLIIKPIALSQSAIQDIVFQSNPEYQSAKLRSDFGAVSINRAQLNYYPDIGVGFDYIGTGDKSINGVPVNNSGKDPLVFMVSLNLPIWINKNRQQVSAARYQYRSNTELLQAVENRLSVEIEQIWFELEDAQRKINLYSQGLIPKSIESLRATEVAYISEQLDFLNLVDAQRRYLQFLLESERSLVQYQKAYARLEYLAGREL